MASLIENLIEELNKEYVVYEQLMEVSMEKTGAIVSNDLDRLRTTTDKEQLLVDTITGLDIERRKTMDGIAQVLGKPRGTVRITEIVDMLSGQPEFHDPLQEINTKLGRLAKSLKDVNAHNQNLIQTQLEMINYSINLLQNIDRAPETAEYSKDMFKGRKGGYGDTASVTSGSFDSKN